MNSGRMRKYLQNLALEWNGSKANRVQMITQEEDMTWTKDSLHCLKHRLACTEDVIHGEKNAIRSLRIESITLWKI